MTLTAAAAPRWKTIIEKALSQHKNQNVMQVATIESITGAHDDVDPIPRVRSQIFRNFLSKPNAPSLPLLVSSTDVRTPKVAQLTSNSKSEIVWWIEGTKQQFRLLADIYIVPSPSDHALRAKFLERLKEAEEGTGISMFKDDGEEAWESRRVELFESMSPHMKASWCRPTPGSPLKGGQEEAKKWPTRVDKPNKETMPKEEYEQAKRNWEMALGNFVLFVINPVEIDFVDLGVAPNRRFLFQKKREGGSWVWDEEELVP